jgi:hypothetical protein
MYGRRAGVERRMGSITQGSTSTARNKPGPTGFTARLGRSLGLSENCQDLEGGALSPPNFRPTLTAQRPPSQSATDFSDSLSLSRTIFAAQEQTAVIDYPEGRCLLPGKNTSLAGATGPLCQHASAADGSVLPAFLGMLRDGSRTSCASFLRYLNRRFAG